MNRVSSPTNFVADALALIGVPACAYSNGGTVLAANAELIALLESDPCGQTVESLFARHLRGASAARLCDATAGQRWDSCLASASGKYIAVQVWTKPLPAGGGIDGGTIVFHDISDVQRSQRALRNTLLEQQAILDNAAVGILFGKDGRIAECNIRCAEMLGYSREELEGAPSVTVYPSEEDFLRLGREAGPPLAQGLPFKTELVLRRKDGSTFWARLFGRAIDTIHTSEGTVWIVEDINEHRIDEEKLRRALIEQKAILDNASIGILFSKGQIVRNCNRSMAQMFGYAVEDMVGLPAPDIFPSRERYQAFVQDARAKLDNGKPYESPAFELKRKDGALIWCRVRANAMNEVNTAGGAIWII